MKHLLFVFLCCVFSGYPLPLSAEVNTNMSLNDLYTHLLSDELYPIDKTTVGHSPAYYALRGFYAFQHVQFEFQRSTDEFWDKRYLNGGDTLIVNKGIAFENCHFPEVFWFLFRSMVFNETISFVQTDNIRFKFKDCVFKGPVQLRIGTMGQFMEFENCVFERGFEILEGAQLAEFLLFKNCTFRYQEDFIKDPKVHKDQYNIGEILPCPRYFYFANNTQELDCTFLQCAFLPVKDTSGPYFFYIDLSHSMFKSLEFTNCSIEVPINLSFISVANQFKLFATSLRSIAAEAMNINSSNAKIDWDNFKGYKLQVTTNDKKFVGGKGVIHDKYLFETLISTYALLYQSYKEQGNRLSANSCYVEWKDLESAYLKERLMIQPDINTWFSWFMDVFLRFFCDYGTNPFKSLVWSFIVMGIFTVLYFILLWNHDTTEHQDIRFILHTFGSYFTADKSFIDIANQLSSYKEENNGQALRSYILDNKSNLPLYYTLFSLRMSMRRIHFPLYRIYVYADKIFGLWKEASELKKKVIQSIIGIWLFTLMLKVLIIRIFDAFTMSLNSFSTLGYGELPANEWVRYLTIIEGFIGWFLLSIFSVALISQIIQ
ncbi:MAG: potassium channel family protein [Cytophagaceae bacterium]|nr:potassium channel family protein [Cytophagaceae bacterium]